MIRKFMISGLLFVFFTGTSAFSQNTQNTQNIQTSQNTQNLQTELPKDNTKDILSFEKRFKAVDESIKYLKTNNIDSNDIITAYTEAESLFHEIKSSTELKDYDMAVKFLSHNLSVLEEKSSERVSLAKRMNLMYIVMVAMGFCIIAGLSIYSIYMYSRRK